MESIMGWKLSWDGNCQGKESLKGWHLSRDKICQWMEPVKGWTYQGMVPLKWNPSRDETGPVPMGEGGGHMKGRRGHPLGGGG